jgi:putative acetyltransferase
LSLVAEAEDEIVGHILFSRMWIDTQEDAIAAAALAPMAVLPAYQRQGIGSLLVRQGVNLLREREERVILVLGHRTYYPRFGFSAEKARFLESPFPRDAFMALELVPGVLDGVHGGVRYSPAFGL